MTAPVSNEDEPAWRWVDRPWNLQVPQQSHLVTTLEVLTGTPPKTVFRWEADQWEALDRDPARIDPSDARVTPIGVLAAITRDWSRLLDLDVGQGVRRLGGGWVSEWLRLCGETTKRAAAIPSESEPTC